MTSAVFVLLAILVLAGGFYARRRIREAVQGRRPVVTDEVMRRILEEGAAGETEDEPLDEEAIREAEERFWDEEWEEPEGLEG